MSNNLKIEIMSSRLNVEKCHSTKIEKCPGLTEQQRRAAEDPSKRIYWHASGCGTRNSRGYIVNDANWFDSPAEECNCGTKK